MKIRKFILPAALAALVIILPGCGKEEKKEEPKPAQTKVRTPAPPPETVSVTGKVEEILDAGDFIFLLVATADAKVWTTVPKVEVAIGETVSMHDANLLENFHSRSLDRVFPEVFFSPGIEGKVPIMKRPAAAGGSSERTKRRSMALSQPPQ